MGGSSSIRLIAGVSCVAPGLHSGACCKPQYHNVVQSWTKWAEEIEWLLSLSISWIHVKGFILLYVLSWPALLLAVRYAIFAAMQVLGRRRSAKEKTTMRKTDKGTGKVLARFSFCCFCLPRVFVWLACCLLAFCSVIPCINSLNKHLSWMMKDSGDAKRFIKKVWNYKRSVESSWVSL